MKKKDPYLWLIGAAIVILIFILWLITLYTLKDIPDRGTFGDMFGSINALFSGLALAGIIFTIFLQKKELEYQREELKATRNEFIIQNKTLKLQRFENTFFSLLNLHHQIVNDIDISNTKIKPSGRISSPMDREYETIKINGRDVFKDKYEIFYVSVLEELDETEFDKQYLFFYSTIQTDFGHYFRNLYRIIKFVHNYDFSTDSASNKVDKSQPEIKYEYISMIRAQLSDYELLWIFYNCLSTNGNEKFKPLLEEYTLLKNLPKNLIHKRNWTEKYKEIAFNKT